MLDKFDRMIAQKGGSRMTRLDRPYIRREIDDSLRLPQSLYFGLRNSSAVRDRLPSGSHTADQVDDAIASVVFEVWQEIVAFCDGSNRNDHYDILFERQVRMNRRIAAALGLSDGSDAERVSPTSPTFFEEIEPTAYVLYTRRASRIFGNAVMSIFIPAGQQRLREAIDERPEEHSSRYGEIALLHLRSMLIDQVLEDYERTWAVPEVPSAVGGKAERLQLTDEEEYVVRRAHEHCSCLDFENLAGTDPKSQNALLAQVDDDAQRDDNWEGWSDGRARQVARDLGAFVSNEGGGPGSASGTAESTKARLRELCERMDRIREDAEMRREGEEAGREP